MHGRSETLYEAEALTADLTTHRHTIRGTCAEEIEARMRLLYPQALTIFVRLEDVEGPSLPDPSFRVRDEYLLLASFPPVP